MGANLALCAVNRNIPPEANLRSAAHDMARELQEIPQRRTTLKIDKTIRVVPYESKFKAQWDEFVFQSKNGVFLFQRDYVEYHADRFNDFSNLFYEGNELIGLMPGNRADETVVSHGGLTFGGIITGSRMTVDRMLLVVSALTDDLRARGIKKLIYKAIPHIYHVLPAEEDLYALSVHNARLFRRDISSTIAAGRRLPLGKNRKNPARLTQDGGLKVAHSDKLSEFMAIAAANLESRHGNKPVHTVAEMELLANRFPENIKLFTASREEEMLGGVIIYESANVAHTQYIGTTAEGKTLGALDAIMDVLLNEVYREKPYIDLGTSLDNDRRLNPGLIRNKESFGARATLYDSYELTLA